MAKVGAILGLIFTIAFTVIMASYTYNAYLDWQDAEKEVQIAKQQLQIATDEFYNTDQFEVTGIGGVVDSR